MSAAPSELPPGEVEETWEDPDLGVRVERVVRTRPDGEEVRWLTVHRKRRVKFGSLTGDGETRTISHVRVAEFPESVATEVLFGLAEVHGYDLEGE